MSIALMPYFLVAMTLPLLLLAQRWIHRHLHGLAYLVTGNKNWAVVLYAIILFPGVLLHELSHYLTAKGLGVRTGSLSLLPKAKADGTIQLGYVEYYKSRSLGPTRESLIGSAPLVIGTAVVLLIARQVFDVAAITTAIGSGDVEQLAPALSVLFATKDFLLWLYLIFAISTAMIPSASDRRAWPAFVLILAAMTLALYLLGATEWLFGGLSQPTQTIFGFLGLAFSLALGVDLFFMGVIYTLEWLIGRLKGVEVVYRSAGSSPPQR